MRLAAGWILLVLAATTAAGEVLGDDWYAIHIAGSRAGHAHVRTVRTDAVNGVEGSVLYVTTTGGALVRVSAAGPGSAVIDETPLTSGPSDMVFSESRQMAVVAQPIPDGVDRVTFVPPGDLNQDGTVDVTDFLLLLAAWGPCPDPPDPCPADLDGDGMVGITDFLIMLANWG